MYEAFFGLRQRPFAVAARPDWFFPGHAIDAARQSLERAIDRAEGTVVLIGPAGVGKTLLCRLMVQRFNERFDTVLLSTGRLATRRALLQAILFELGMPYRGQDEGELRLSLLDRLQPRPDGTGGLLLAVDEAHLLPMRLLEELRLLTDFARRGELRVRLMLSGGPALEERLASPRLTSLQQRIAARCYLEAFDRNDASAYIRHQITVAGGDPEQVFTDAALEAVYRATDGIPRLINQTCDHALVMAFAGGVRPIDAAGIEEAWADLQQLPTPANLAAGYEGPPSEADDSVIEYGLLDDLATAAESSHHQTARDALAELPAASLSAPVGEALPSVLPVDAERHADEKLDELDSHLADWEAEFRPPTKREPEVELVLGPSRRNPFVENFVEEVAVVDRYSAIERSQVAGLNSPYASRGKFDSDFTVVRRDAPEVKPSQSARVDDAEHVVESAAPQPSRPLPVVRPDAAWQAAPPHAAFDDDVDTVEPEDFVIAASRPAYDLDMIVVEDDPAVESRPNDGVALVRTQDYRQLFAKLRRGE